MNYIILLLTLTLTSCTALDIAKGVLKEPTGISVDAQIGDKTANVGTNDNSQVNLEDVRGDVKVSKSNKNFNDAGQVTINEGLNIWYLIILVLGWLLPSPTRMYKEIRSWFTKQTLSDLSKE
jgi:hypothetical protein